MTSLNGEETIVALASGRGEAGVAVLRLSGSRAHNVLNSVFRPARKVAPTAGKLVYGEVVEENGAPVDDCLAVRMVAPHSFTGEDVAEIQCHGSPAVIRKILELCMNHGARLAEPGEFTRRAFMNGKMDLAQAEALSDLIASRSESARKLALRQLRGGLSARITEIYSGLVDAAAEIEAHLDFPEEDIPSLAQERISGRMAEASAAMRRMLEGHQKGRLQREGLRVVLAGHPNAGKSSLFNALVGRERAIVSPHPGTTRDTIEASLEIGGVEVTLVDTAGIRAAAEAVEQIGIDRTREEIRGSDLVLHLSDDLRQLTGKSVPDLETVAPDKVIRILTKCDQLVGKVGEFPEAVVAISAVTGEGLDALEAAIAARVVPAASDSDEVEMSRARHAYCLQQALDALKRAEDAFASGESGDLVMVDLRDALSYLGEITGERLDEQILDRIFSTFCLGK